MYFAYARYHQGISDFEQDYRDPANDHSTPYPASQYDSGLGYQQSPFSQSPQAPGEYKPPTYWRTEIQIHESNRGVSFLNKDVLMVSCTTRTVFCTPIFFLHKVFL